MITIDFSKHQTLDADPKAIQQINFTGNLENSSSIFFFNEEATKLFKIFTRNYEKFVILFCFDIKQLNITF